MKRKSQSKHVVGSSPKRPRHAVDQSRRATTRPAVDHPVLARLYPEVASLRHHLLSKLPPSSKIRRRKLAQFGLGDPPANVNAIDVELGTLLDSTLVGVLDYHVTDADGERQRDLENFSQQLSIGTTGGSFKPGYFLQPEIVDFVVWRLFKRCTAHKPAHLLCHGFQRSGMQGVQGLQKTSHSIPGLFSRYRNAGVETLKNSVWCRLHALLGKGGDAIMMDMLTDCGVFSPVPGAGNYIQLSGVPLSDIKSEKPKETNGPDRTPSAITFVRNRMLYARAALNAKGGVRFGLRHIHVLNRFPDIEDAQQTVHIMRYIFPRQYGLHNAFTSTVDKRETSMTFKDYTLREDEIHQVMCRELAEKSTDEAHTVRWKLRIPKRLRGDTVALVEKMRKLNERCSYVELLRHYCPVEVVHLSSKPDWRKNALQPTAAPADGNKEMSKSKHKKSVEQTCFTDMACPTTHVSAFCRAVMAKVIPHGFWGSEHNRRIVAFWIDEFICLRRFESLNLHQVTQELQTSAPSWLRPPGHDATANMAKSDYDKRLELFLEFVYWVFDSFLIPLIRTNFYVTESNVHKHRLFFFRHDVWKMLAEPSLSNLRCTVFEEMPAERATRLLALRSLGFSKIRLLPKGKGVRLITNLKQRQQVTRNGSTMLGRSINSIMASAFNIITYEKTQQPDRFGGSLFSVGDMAPKLAAYKASLQEQGLSGGPLYFAKVDVQSCFDTIPQKRLLAMVESLLSLPEYQTGKHVEVSALGQLQRLDGQYVNPPPLKRYVAHGGAAEVVGAFDRLVQDKFVGTKTNTVFVQMGAQQLETRDNLMQLLREHVERNLVKIGKRFYRQKTGIPQGSVLSTILCNFFYAELERNVLSFALGSDSLLLRLLDDFCLITTQREHAERFVHVMHRGHVEYGVTVRAAKSLANFDVATEDGNRIPRCASGVRFPYCGVMIEMHTLEVSKNSERTALTKMSDGLTVDLGKVPGQTFHRKALNAFKIQLQGMFIDTCFNSVPTVLANLYQSFYEAAVRTFGYARSLAKSRSRPVDSRLLIKIVDSIMGLAFVMLQRRTRRKANQNAELACSVISRRQIRWLACRAFEVVFQQRQTQHQALLAWIRTSLATVRLSKTADRCMLEDAVRCRLRSDDTTTSVDDGRRR